MNATVPMQLENVNDDGDIVEIFLSGLCYNNKGDQVDIHVILPINRWDAEEFLIEKGISNHPHIQDSVTGKKDYEVADLMTEFVNNIINVGNKGCQVDMMASQIWEIWTEGWCATGCEGIPQEAKFHGKFEGKTFTDAIRSFRDSLDDEYSRSFVDMKNQSFWGCRFYDNETDARKAFG